MRQRVIQRTKRILVLARMISVRGLFARRDLIVQRRGAVLTGNSVLESQRASMPQIPIARITLPAAPKAVLYVKRAVVKVSV